MKEGLSEDVVYIDLLEGKGLLASFGDITLLEIGRSALEGDNYIYLIISL